MIDDLTIIYYSSNKEKPEFEQRIRDNILKVCGDLPIISVTQKPVNFGNNICVGDVGVSGFNLFRQVLIACKTAKTKFVASIEADCLYPPDYFQFRPQRDDMCFRDENLYILVKNEDYFQKKPWGSVCAQVVGREFYIETLERLFGDAPDWNIEEANFPKERSGHKQYDIFWHDKVLLYKTENPIVSIKTGRGLRSYTPMQSEKYYNIPYWGDGQEFVKKYIS